MSAAVSLAPIKERPILFKGEMVRAIQAGIKTQTRRLVTVPWKGSARAFPYEPYWLDDCDNPGRLIFCDEYGDYRPATDYLQPYGIAGNRLWVRETWRTHERERDGIDGIQFAADDTFVPIENSRAAADLWIVDHDNGRHGENWRPSIFMRRWASRLTLDVIGTRIERLHAITEADALAEGIQQTHVVDPGDGMAVQNFSFLWDRINKKRAPWSSNPWVHVVEFRKVVS